MIATLDNKNIIFNSWENVGFLEYIIYCNDSRAIFEYENTTLIYFSSI